MEAIVVAHRASLPEPPTTAEPPAVPAPTAAPDPQSPSEPPKPLPVKEIRLVTRTRERYSQIQQLLVEDVSRAEVGRRLGLDSQTVRRFADATDVSQLLANTHRDSVIDPYTAHLHQRWNDGCTDTAVLFAEIHAQASAAASRHCAATCDSSGRSSTPPDVGCQR